MGNRIAFHLVDITTLGVPFRWFRTYREYTKVIWDCHISCVRDELTENERLKLGQVEFEIACLIKEGLKASLVFSINRNQLDDKLKNKVAEIGTLDFARRVMQGMYSDHGLDGYNN